MALLTTYKYAASYVSMTGNAAKFGYNKFVTEVFIGFLSLLLLLLLQEQCPEFLQEALQKIKNY
jgi:hypothetical protein